MVIYDLKPFIKKFSSYWFKYNNCSQVHSVHPPFLLGEGWLNLVPNFSKGGFGRTSTLREGLLVKRGVTFFRGGVAIFTKKLN